MDVFDRAALFTILVALTKPQHERTLRMVALTLVGISVGMYVIDAVLKASTHP